MERNSKSKNNKQEIVYSAQWFATDDNKNPLLSDVIQESSAIRSYNRLRREYPTPEGYNNVLVYITGFQDGNDIYHEVIPV